MAIGDLKQVLCESINHSALSQFSDTLWAQFEGLASAIQFLHDRCQMVHRDIKSSNILIYRHTDSPRLIAKLADFGMARNYTVESENIRKLLHYEDIWKLGTVFAELLTYLGGGTEGVKQFYKYTIVNYDDNIHYTADNVKLDIMLWLSLTLRDQPWGHEVTEITLRMLGT